MMERERDKERKWVYELRNQDKDEDYPWKIY